MKGNLKCSFTLMKQQFKGKSHSDFCLSSSKKLIAIKTRKNHGKNFYDHHIMSLYPAAVGSYPKIITFK